MNESILSASGMFYTYHSSGKKISALNGIDLSVRKGDIFGFIGPNGAGKTTTIKLLLGILTPQKGKIDILAGDPSDTGTRRKIGYMPEIANYYRYLTPAELLAMYGNIFGLNKKLLKQKIKELLLLVGLGKETNRLMGTFSKGMMQKVSFAQALINDPELLILDEPTSGLDPLARINMRDVIKDLAGRGKTVFFSSHELSEIEMICDDVAIIKEGKILESGKLKDIIENKGTAMTLEQYFLNIMREPTEC